MASLPKAHQIKFRALDEKADQAEKEEKESEKVKKIFLDKLMKDP